MNIIKFYIFYVFDLHFYEELHFCRLYYDFWYTIISYIYYCISSWFYIILILTYTHVLYIIMGDVRLYIIIIHDVSTITEPLDTFILYTDFIPKRRITENEHPSVFATRLFPVIPGCFTYICVLRRIRRMISCLSFGV